MGLFDGLSATGSQQLVVQIKDLINAKKVNKSLTEIETTKQSNDNIENISENNNNNESLNIEKENSK